MSILQEVKRSGLVRIWAGDKYNNIFLSPGVPEKRMFFGEKEQWSDKAKHEWNECTAKSDYCDVIYGAYVLILGG